MIKKVILLTFGLMALSLEARVTSEQLIADIRKLQAWNLFEVEPSFQDWFTQIGRIKDYINENARSDKTITSLYNVYVDLFSRLATNIKSFYQSFPRLSPYAPKGASLDVKLVVPTTSYFYVIYRTLEALNTSLRDIKFIIPGKKNALAVLYTFGVQLKALAYEAYIRAGAVYQIKYKMRFPYADEQTLLPALRALFTQIKAKVE